MAQTCETPPLGAAGRISTVLLRGNDRNNARKAEVAQAKSRGGRRPRQKGDRLERAIVRLLQDSGLGAERVPLSGSAGGSYSGDISCPSLGADRIIEVKARANGFREIYAWIAERDALILRADRKEVLVVVRLALAAEITAAAEKGKP